MTEQPTPPIDPRFDPAFQRGYADSPSHTADERWGLGAVARTWQSGRADARGAGAGAGADSDAGFQDAAAAAAAAGAASATAASVIQPPPAGVGTPGHPVATLVSPAALGEEPHLRTSRHNPFVYVLAALSILLVASGASIIVQAAESQTSGVMSQGDMVAQQLAWSLAPPMFNGGVLGLVGLAVYLAFAWQRTELLRAKSGRVAE